MASAYDKASLVMLPHAVKEGKLYSVKPEDRSGDFTFSRGTDTATRVNSSGLIEKERSNQLLQSNTFDTTWASSSTTETSGQSGYDGSSDAWLLDKSASSGNVNQNVSVSGVNTFSVYVKAGSESWVALLAAGPNAGKFFDLSGAGAVGTNLVNAPLDASIEAIGGGWFRISITTNGSVTQVRIYPAEGDGVSSGTSGNIYIQDAQLEQGLVATDYIETTTAAVYEGITDNLPRLDYHNPDSPTPNSCPSLKLEPSRTNLIDHSEYISTSTWSTARVDIDSNSIISPEGGSNGTYIEQQTGQTLGGAVFKNISFSAGNYTTSIFAKAGGKKFLNIGETASASGTFRTWFDLENGTIGTTHSGHTPKIEDFGNGWYLCSITYTANAGSFATIFYLSDSDNSTSVTDSGGLYLYGAQLEAGSYPTSYIPTYGTSASRAADVVNNTSATDVIGQTEGTIFIELKGNFDETAPVTFLGDSGNRIEVLTRNNGKVGIYVYNGSGQADFQSSSTYTNGQNMKIAFAYKANDFVLYVNGVQEGSDTSGAVPTGMSIVRYNALWLSGYAQLLEAKQSLLFKTRLTNAELEALTTI